MKNLQDILTEKRKELKLSLRKAADKIGVSHSYLSTLEKGRDPRSNSPVKPTPETLKLVSEAYGIDYNFLMESAGYLKTFNEFNIETTKDEDFQKIYNFILNHLVENISKHYNSESKDDIQSKEFLERMKDNWDSLNEYKKIGLIESAIAEAKYNKYSNKVSLVQKFGDETFQEMSESIKKEVLNIKKQNPEESEGVKPEDKPITDVEKAMKVILEQPGLMLNGTMLSDESKIILANSILNGIKLAKEIESHKNNTIKEGDSND